jgi:hypothetical protein
MGGAAVETLKAIYWLPLPVIQSVDSPRRIGLGAGKYAETAQYAAVTMKRKK